MVLTKKKDVDHELRNVQATLSFEGLTPSKRTISINRKMLSGKITGEEARRMILSKYNLKVK